MHERRARGRRGRSSLRTSSSRPRSGRCGRSLRGRAAAPMRRRSGARAVTAPFCGGQVAEVCEQPRPSLGADRLGMELHAPQRPVTMRHAHDDAVTRPGDRHQPLGQRLRDAQRVVADRLRTPGECPRTAAISSWKTALSRPCITSGAWTTAPPLKYREPLVAQAHAEHRARRRPRSRPRQTPKSLPVAPAGPARGRSRCCRTPARSSSSHVAPSLRTTIGSSPLTSARSWKRLNVNES